MCLARRRPRDDTEFGGLLCRKRNIPVKPHVVTPSHLVWSIMHWNSRQVGKESLKRLLKGFKALLAHPLSLQAEGIWYKAFKRNPQKRSKTKEKTYCSVFSFVQSCRNTCTLQLSAGHRFDSRTTKSTPEFHLWISPLILVAKNLTLAYNQLFWIIVFHP